MLKISDDLSLPVDAATETFGLLAVRGAGKTNTARVMAEEMFAAGVPFVAVDPVGSWYGLRSSRDGKSPGIAVPIFGGRYGDLPLDKGAGNLIADLVVDQRLSCVIDLTGFESEGARKGFLLDFARRLYQRNEQPLHLFLEEADDYIPQRPMRDEAQLLRAWENIVRRGRSRGLGMTLITQRSASISKSVLTQVGTLIAMRTTSPQDRAAVEAWIKYHGQREEVLASLASLGNGEAWVWSPHFLGTTERVKFRLSNTYDSGKTPKMGDSTRSATLADVDLAEVERRMGEVVERAKSEDPRELLRRVKELETALAAAQAATAEPVTRIVPALTPDDLAATLGTSSFLDTIAQRLQSLSDELAATSRGLGEGGAEIRARVEAARARALAAGDTSDLAAHPVADFVQAEARAAARRPAARADGEISGPQRRILDALAWMETAKVRTPTKVQVAFLAEASPTSSSFTNNLGTLRSAGLIDYPSGGLVTLTDAGRGLANKPVRKLTSADLQERFLARLQPAKARLLARLIEIYPRDIPKVRLAEEIGQSATSSSYTNNLGSLRTLGLLDYPSPGSVAALPILFV